jgi:hypothetical protein
MSCPRLPIVNGCVTTVVMRYPLSMLILTFRAFRRLLPAVLLGGDVDASDMPRLGSTPCASRVSTCGAYQSTSSTVKLR